MFCRRSTEETTRRQCRTSAPSRRRARTRTLRHNWRSPRWHSTLAASPRRRRPSPRSLAISRGSSARPGSSAAWRDAAGSCRRRRRPHSAISTTPSRAPHRSRRARHVPATRPRTCARAFCSAISPAHATSTPSRSSGSRPRRASPPRWGTRSTRGASRTPARSIFSRSANSAPPSAGSTRPSICCREPRTRSTAPARR